MNVSGIGIVSACGRGVESVENLSARGWVAPAFVDVPFQEEPFPVYAVDPATLKDRAVLGSMRRADRFSKMAALAAHDAVADSGVELEAPERVGVIFATAFGPHNTTFRFLDDILDYGDPGVSPTVFSNAVHNAAVSYVSRLLGIKGPTWTMTSFARPFEQAAELAQVWLDEGRCDRVLVGAGDECGTVLEYICREKLPIAMDGRVAENSYVPGEGAAFFLVNGSGPGPELQLPVKDHASFFGNMLTGAALDCAVELIGKRKETQ